MIERITDEELSSLLQAMKNRYDLDFSNYEKKSFKRSIARLMMKHKIKSVLELWSKIIRDKEFFLESIDDLLVNLTELFRNPDAWIKIRDQILPNFEKSPKLRIWHAGCSTGEEVYTMGIVLEEKNILSKSNILATDLSSTALAAAIKGEYSLLILKQYLKPFLEFYPRRKMEDFFNFSDKFAVIKHVYQRHVRFLNHNLVHDEMTEKFDIIFCRNVMIYFDEKLKLKVLKMFYDCLNPGGTLIIGYYDIMPDAGKEMFDAFDVKTRIYKKRDNIKIH